MAGELSQFEFPTIWGLKPRTCEDQGLIQDCSFPTLASLSGQVLRQVIVDTGLPRTDQFWEEDDCQQLREYVQVIVWPKNGFIIYYFCVLHSFCLYLSLTFIYVSINISLSFNLGLLSPPLMFPFSSISLSLSLPRSHSFLFVPFCFWF